MVDDLTENMGKAIYLSIGHGFGDNLMAAAAIAVASYIKFAFSN